MTNSTQVYTTRGEGHESDALLSDSVDALTIVIESEDDRRLRMARELILTVALPPQAPILVGHEELDR